MQDLPAITPEMVEAYWRLKKLANQPGYVAKLPVWDLLVSMARAIGDDDWPNLKVFDKLWVDPENNALKPDA